MGLVWESAPLWTLANAITVTLQGLLPLASLYLMKLIVDSANVAYSSADKGQAFEKILMLMALAGGVAVLSALTRSCSSVISEVQASLVSDHVQNIMHTQSVALDLEYYETPKYYDTFHRAQQEAPFRPTKVVNGLAQAFQSIITMGSMVVLLVSLNWAIALGLIVASIPGLLVRLIYSGRMYRWQLECTEKQRKTWYFHWLLTNEVHAKEIRLLCLGELFKNRYNDLQKHLRHEHWGLTASRSAADFAAQVFGMAAVFGAMAFIAYRRLNGDITLGDMVMYFGAFQQGQTYLSSLLSSLAGLYEDGLFLTTLYDFMELEPKVKEPSKPVEVPNPIKEGISFENVSFQYPGSNIAVLTGVTLKITPGQIIALVGENGSGKTTMVKLLCRLYDPQKGMIAIDGVNLKDFRLSDLRRAISVVFQDYCHYNFTAAENVWLGSADTPLDMGRVVKAAEDAGADEVIRRLEKGYQTVLGKWFHGGAELSMGEWQKVALARAFLRDSQFLILDEPTSSLDPKAEAEVFVKFLELIKGKTAILISHRLSTVRAADCIYFLKDGEVIERGTHDQLITLKGEYAKLFEIQAANYR